MHQFLINNRNELVARCRLKVQRRAASAALPPQRFEGIPQFLEQLIRTLEVEEKGEHATSEAISGPPGGDARALSQIGASAVEHGQRLLAEGYTIDQVVHDYGDLCQSITDLAIERDAPFTVSAYRTLNRCLDNAIADSVSSFAVGQADTVALARLTSEHERWSALLHELRNSLHAANMSYAALVAGALPLSGATGGVLRRSLEALTSLISAALKDAAHERGTTRTFPLAAFIADAADAAALDADARSCSFTVDETATDIGLFGNREHLMSALANLLQNAFKFTRHQSSVSLRAYVTADRVHIDVSDHCGGLPIEATESLFDPFKQAGKDRSGMGLGLSIARRNVEADGGSLSVRDSPGVGCTFTISLPQKPMV